MVFQEHRDTNRVFIYYLSLLGFFAIFSTTISKNPVLPLFAQSLGSGDALIGLIAAVSPFAGILLSFPAGVLSDNIGRKRLLMVAGLVFLSAPLLYLFVFDPWLLIPIRFFHGTATAILGPIISALIAERFTETRGEMLGWYSSSTLAGRTIAPLAGGIVISYFASSAGLFQYQAVYLIAFASAIPVFILTLLYREEHRDSHAIIGATQFGQSFRKFFSDRSLRATALVDMATYFSFGTFETFLPVFLVTQGFAVYEIGFIFSLQVVLIALTKPFFGRVADRIDKRKQILTGVVLIGLSVAAIPFLSQFWEFVVVSILTGLGISLSTVATAAFVADVCEKKELGASMGALSSIMDIGHSGGPLVTGIVIALINFQAGFLTSLVVSVVIAVVFVLSVFTGAKEDRGSKRAC